jgi:hypothetical protein
MPCAIAIEAFIAARRDSDTRRRAGTARRYSAITPVTV